MVRAPGAMALLLLVCLSAGVWAIGRGIPYGYDAAQTYETYLSAYNATTFANVDALLDDVSTSADPSAHPAYDVRAPQLIARALSQLLIRLGVMDLRVHDGVAVAISAVGVLLALLVLRRIGGRALAATAIVLFALHYLGVLTWTSSLAGAVVFPLFWGSLYVLLRYFERPSGWLLGAAALCIASAFLSDLTLGVFVLLTLVFATWQLAQPVHTRLSFTLAALGGALAATAGWFAVVASAVGPSAVADNLPRLGPNIGDAYALRQGVLIAAVYAVVVLEIVGLVRSGFRRTPHLTVSGFIVAAGLAGILVHVSAPEITFVEDVILASLVLAALRHVDLRQRRWPSVALGGLLVLGGVYWLGLQVLLAEQHPPTESALASLRGNAMLSGASLLAADNAPAVWYYTRADVRPAAPLGPDHPGQFLVCTVDCDQWSSAGLQDVAHGPGYRLFALPACQTDGQPTCSDASSTEQALQVQFTTSPTSDGYLAHVTFTPQQNPAEAGAIVRLYAQATDGTLCLLDERLSQGDFPLPHVSSGRFVAAVVIPFGGTVPGAQYFSPPVEVLATRLFELPNTRAGGTQQIRATSLEEAEQIAIQQGTWAPGAGTLGDDAVTALSHYPPADELCRGADWGRRKSP
jgi:hypothetical protein